MVSRAMKQVLKSGDEFDVVTKWRKMLHWQRGEIRKIKRNLNKRFRKEGKVMCKDKWTDV
jgi:hypothetical protein